MKTKRPSLSKAMVVSDLDGTLLDHDSYDYEAAWPALQRLKKAHIPLLLNTSKTLAEMRQWVQALGLDTPFVIENGAAMVSANEKALHLWGRPREQILSQLQQIRKASGWQFQGFHDLGVPGIRTHSGLSLTAAEAALNRGWTEPLIWQDTPQALAAFRTQLQLHDLQLLRGGRFYHVQARHDKATPLPAIRKLYNAPRVIAFGDGQNDAALLSSADFAVRVRSPKNAFPALSSCVEYMDTHKQGPQGWNEAIHELFERGLLNDE